MNEWKPIHTAPKTGEDIIVGYDHASIWFIHLAWWDDGEDVGWWSHVTNSVSQVNINPTHWMELPSLPNKED